MLKGSILQKLRDAHRPEYSAQRPLNFGVYYKNTLVALCHALEDSILTNDYSPLVITAFQQGKWYLQEADRYSDIAEQSQQIVIMAGGDAGFADHATSQRSNVALVSLNSDDPVAQEWHLIILSPNYTAMVLCQELTEEDYGAAGMPDTDLERKFYGFWTFEPTLILETAQLAIEHVGRYNPELQQTLQAQVQAIQAQSSPEPPPIVDRLSDIVARVVDYLHSSQQELTHNADYTTGARHLDNNLISNELQAFLRVAQLLDQTDLSNPMAAAEVATLAETLGQLLDLPAWQLNRLRLAGLLHRLAFLEGIEETGMFLNTGSSPRYQDEAPSLPLTCPLVPGTQVLRKMPRLRAIATILTHQAEWWNGAGKPAGLSGDEIPIESRILGLVAYFQMQFAQHRAQQTHAAVSNETNPLVAALTACQQQQGDRWDPKLVDTLALLVSGLQQGLDLSVALPKIAAGIWLLDSHSEDDLLSLYREVDFSTSTSTPVS
ncbi:metal-dependent phosphohydrolase [Oculatella sp. LEGE 06141]|uniref:DICT sensory domain-containing protein n=1 Tax=Oculatella sp. LEGE 06141 TaxID=1828648 RepID=UPI0018819306|nr:DICT sensory domain-containing protein [Oculatella sp. LEGE 06141]MBE9178189.1 metal-dependent phosphohydrolase [Oculatella sp. LEGE 06141]